MKKIMAHKRITLASVAALGVVLCAFALAFANATRPDPPGSLPPMTLTYEVSGPEIGVGDRTIGDYRETVRLEYRSKTDWTETIIESPTHDLGRYGAGTNQGSYRKLKGNVVTEYDAMDGSTGTYTVGDWTELPNATFAYTRAPVVDPLGPGITSEAVTSEARVCFNGDCRDNAAGVKYTKDGREIVLLQGDGFVLPIKNGDLFVLKTAEIQADRPQ